ncbi:SNARE associated Golgi protein [Planctomycetes bacterium Pan216]|uniref:TVP38/TMEM64 family membrane protein n=1 Tax=Kolteria novifilia TaxID=2527975 RepID=A0A518B3T4_9BACT|nr:SNARE associated Golgi protein [Planctomycetes bacterium Pan216]
MSHGLFYYINHSARQWVWHHKNHWRAYLVRGLIGLAVLGVLYVVGSQVGQYIPALETWIDGLGPIKYVAYGAIFIALTSFFIPQMALGLAAGALFGLVWGTLTLFLSATTGAVLMFWLARLFLRKGIHAYLDQHAKLAAVIRAVHQHGLRIMILMRLGPVNYSMLNYLLGSSDVKFRNYTIALIGMLPGNLASVYFGSVAKHVMKIAGHVESHDNYHDTILFGGLILYALVSTFLAHYAYKALREANMSLAAHHDEALEAHRMSNDHGQVEETRVS